MPKLQISSNILLVPNYQMGRGKERLKRQRRKIRSIRKQQNPENLSGRKTGFAQICSGQIHRKFLKTGEQLRANVCKNRAKSKFRGHSQKIVFAYILSID